MVRGNRHFRSTVIGFKAAEPEPLACLSDFPTNMKRGFLNRKAKDKPLYDNGASASSAAVIAPSKQSPPSGGGATAISRRVFDPYTSPPTLTFNVDL